MRAGVLIERLKAYEPELPKDMEPMVYVNYCEENDLMNPRCQKLSELDAKTAEMDKEWYAKRDPKTDELMKIAKIYVTVYYAEKGEQKLHHFKKSMDIGNGHGSIVSQLKYDNEMKEEQMSGEQVPKRMQWLRMREKIRRREELVWV